METHIKKLRGLLITQYYPPDITAASFRMEDTAKAMHALGIQTTVLTAIPHRIVMKHSVDKEINGIRVVRVNVPNAGGGTISRILNYTGFALKATLVALFKLKKNYDVVIVTSPPLFVAVTGYIVSKINRAWLIADVRDIWPDTAVAAAMLKEGTILYKISLLVEKFFYKSANQITCVSKPMQEHIAKFVNQERVTILYNGVSEELVEAAQIQQSRFTDDKEDTIKIVYAGNVGRLQGIDTILSALSQLKKSGKENYELTIVGDGIEHANLVHLAEDLLLTKVNFIGAVPREKVGLYCADADVLFMHLVSHPVLEKTIPSKLFDYLLYCKPILAGIRGEGKDIIESLGTGVTFEPGNVGDLARALAKLNDDLNVLKKAAFKNRDYVLQNFYRPKAIKAFYKRIVDKL